MRFRLFQPSPRGEPVAFRNIIMRTIRALPAVLLLVLPLPATAAAAPVDRAITVDQIAALSQAGVSDAVIIAMIERDQPIFTIDPAEVVRLQQDGLSEQLIVAMLASGTRRSQESPPAPTPQTFVLPVPVVVPYVIAVPVAPTPCLIMAAPISRSAPSTRGIFFSQPTAGIFFNPPAVKGSPCGQTQPLGDLATLRRRRTVRE